MYVPIVILPSAKYDASELTHLTGNKVLVRMVSWDADKDYPLG
jgi:hypothetical protein